MAKTKTANRPGIENLVPAKPGEVRNPTGTNGATKRREMLREIGLDVMSEPVKGKDAKGRTVYLGPEGWSAVCRTMRNKAIKGDVGAATWLRDTLIGKPALAITGPDGGPLIISYAQLVLRESQGAGA